MRAGAATKGAEWRQPPAVEIDRIAAGSSSGAAQDKVPLDHVSKDPRRQSTWRKGDAREHRRPLRGTRASRAMRQSIARDLASGAPGYQGRRAAGHSGTECSAGELPPRARRAGRCHRCPRFWALAPKQPPAALRWPAGHRAKPPKDSVAATLGSRAIGAARPAVHGP